MGSKSKVRSMQRGAQKRDDEPRVTNEELYSVSPPLLTEREISYFQFGNRTIEDFFKRMEPQLKAFQTASLSASRVAEALNKVGALTANGQKWTPRLAWFLMSTWRAVDSARRDAAKKTAQLSKNKDRLDVRTRVESKLDRVITREKELGYRDAIKGYFKNPTFADAFPQLSELRKRLSGEKSQDQAASNLSPEKSASLSNLVGNEKQTPSETKAPVLKNDIWPGTAKNKSSRSSSKEAFPTPIKGSKISGFLRTSDGQDYLTHCIGSYFGILTSASKPITNEICLFLGFLRAQKVTHPYGEYWQLSDALELRSLLLHRNTQAE